MSGWPQAGERPAAGRRRGRRPGPCPDPDAPDAAPPAGGSAQDDPGDPAQVARSICLRALTGAARTRQQLAELLARRGIPDDVAESVLDRFGEVGLIDDAAFARAWVTSRQSGRGLARRVLKAELRAKGVDGEVAEEAVTLVDDQDEWDAARRLVQRRLPGMRRVDRATAERRLVGMLARRGYGGGLASWVVREALDDDRSDDDRSGDDRSDDDRSDDDRTGADAAPPGASGGPGLDAWLP
ncbi:regulatory protein RecX [Geodermatophilus sp. DSM 44513]|uniref:regulatory protein RecX n=1 Tax=Geodermatophilus sp. DSM 44513 TaxID=1528104 RepID=UPI0028F6C69E|nr:regulatory protein RecX [Geodermatophilus sp. DSM 44513]WNV74376.1 regulatory protein RecX [Geodermatophilus sp. DSM 44513]